jgi:hypothetical protein
MPQAQASLAASRCTLQTEAPPPPKQPEPAPPPPAPGAALQAVVASERY